MGATVDNDAEEIGGFRRTTAAIFAEVAAGMDEYGDGISSVEEMRPLFGGVGKT